MRRRETNQKVCVHAIAGTHVVLLGLDVSKAAAKGLLGFTILRRKGKGKDVALGGGLIFKGIHRESQRGRVRSDKAPIQAFLWGDYTVDPGTSYTFTVIPVYGTPDALKPGDGVAVTIKTEKRHDGTHGVFFNRGVAGSQSYSRQFGEYRRSYRIGGNDWKEFIKPEDVPDRKAYQWLSRGLEEAMLEFIGQAKGPDYSLRASVYEFTYQPVIQAFVDALERGADVKIVHHCKTQTVHRLKRSRGFTVTVSDGDPATPDVTYKNEAIVEEKSPDPIGNAANRAVAQIGLKDPANRLAYDRMLIVRSVPPISHNKFIVLLKKGKPVQVWTGSTNYTDGGIFGQSNVGHAIRDETVAQAYYDYWEKLSTNPKSSSKKSDPPGTGLRDWTVLRQADLSGPPLPNSITPVFSPRNSEAMLQWYADQIGTAKRSIHFTSAFTISDQFYVELQKKKRRTAEAPYQRYVLLEGITGLLRDKSAVIRKIPQNRVAWGDTLKTRPGQEKEGELIESLTGLNDHVNYLHTKYLLVDPLTNDPLVVTGSANFSKASTVNNDENMVVIRGDTRVADIFLGEFMRLFNHFQIRNELNALSDEAFEAAGFLATDDSWITPYFQEGSQLQQERLLFR